jgi:hypothetical protein
MIHPHFVYVGSRLGQIFHARIHMGCSALNSDLFRKNIVTKTVLSEVKNNLHIKWFKLRQAELTLNVLYCDREYFGGC